VAEQLGIAVAFKVATNPCGSTSTTTATSASPGLPLQRSLGRGFQSQNGSWQLVNLLGSEQAEVELHWRSGRVSRHSIPVGAREIFSEPPASE